jgi:hypothetical protein
MSEPCREGRVEGGGWIPTLGSRAFPLEAKECCTMYDADENHEMELKWRC